MTKDSQISSLKEELVHQEEMVAKLQKEKKQQAQSRQNTDEELQVQMRSNDRMKKGIQYRSSRQFFIAFIQFKCNGSRIIEVKQR